MVNECSSLEQRERKNNRRGPARGSGRKYTGRAGGIQWEEAGREFYRSVVDVLADRRDPKREKKPAPSFEAVLPERERKDHAGDSGRVISCGFGSRWFSRERRGALGGCCGCSCDWDGW